MHGDGRYWKEDIFEYKGEFRDGGPKGYGAGFVSYVDPRTKVRDRKELEGEFDGLQLADDDEEAGLAAADLGASAAAVARDASDAGRARADAARDRSKAAKRLVSKQRAARAGDENETMSKILADLEKVKEEL